MMNRTTRKMTKPAPSTPSENPETAADSTPHNPALKDPADTIAVEMAETPQPEMGQPFVGQVMGPEFTAAIQRYEQDVIDVQTLLAMAKNAQDIAEFVTRPDAPDIVEAAHQQGMRFVEGNMVPAEESPALTAVAPEQTAAPAQTATEQHLLPDGVAAGVDTPHMQAGRSHTSRLDKSPQHMQHMDREKPSGSYRKDITQQRVGAGEIQR